MPPVILLTKRDAGAKPLIIRFDGDYADMWPLFKFRKVANPPGYIKASEFRTKYVALVQASEHGRDASVVIPVNKPKRLLYHYMLIKMLLMSLDLLELENSFAGHWDMDELPMLEQYQFDYWDIRLTTYDRNMIPRSEKITRLFQRRSDQWFNLTAAAIERDGDEDTASDVAEIARSNLALFKKLDRIEARKVPKTLEDEPKSDKKLTAAEKRALSNKYVNTTWSRHETWCHPMVFDETMRTIFWDWRLKSPNAFVNANHVPAARREILKQSALADFEYFPQGPPPADEGSESEDEDVAVGP